MNVLKNLRLQSTLLRQNTFLLISCWIIAVGLSLTWNIINHGHQLHDIVYMVARSQYDKEVLFRRWIAGHGGIYARIDQDTQPNPYLSRKVEERDITTPSGKTLTLINPAYMTRLVNQLVDSDRQIKGHVVSHNPMRPENIADQWELEAIAAFQQGKEEAHAVVERQGEKFLRFIRPLYTEKACLNCHRENAVVGKVQGALSFTLPMKPYHEATRSHIAAMVAAHLFLCILGFLGIYFGSARIQTLIDARDTAERQLKEANDALEKKVTLRTRDLLDSCRTLQQEKIVHMLAEEERTLLSAAIKQSEECIVVTDNKANILFVNPSFERITGYTQKEVLGRPPHFLRSDNHSPLYYQAIRDTLTGNKVWRGHLAIRTKSDKIIDMEASISPVRDQKGNITHFVSVKRDVTNWLKLKKQLHHSQRMEAIGTLAGGIAHDFRNILTVISGYAEMVLESLPDGSLDKSNQQHVIKAADTATELVKQIMTFSCETEQELNPVQFQLIIPETLKLLHPTIPAEIEVVQYIDKSCNPVLANPSQLHRIIMNLCTNSIHAMKNTGGTLSVRLTQLDIGLADKPAELNLKPGSYVHLEVKDSGHGMDEATLDKIFTPYFTTKKKDEGTGLGLSVLHGLTHSLGGNLKVSSSPGKGTTFNVYLPTIESSLPKKTDQESDVQRGLEHIMIVEDINLILELEKNMLENLGYRVTAFLNSIDALEAFMLEPENYDLVLTNLTMPFLSGSELARELQDIRANLPIVLCTGFSEELNPEMLRQLGIKGLLKKPVIKKDLAQMVRKILDERNTEIREQDGQSA